MMEWIVFWMIGAGVSIALAFSDGWQELKEADKGGVIITIAILWPMLLAVGLVTALLKGKK